MKPLLQFVRAPRFSLFQALCIAVIVGAIVGRLPRPEADRPDSTELDGLRSAYGPSRNSEHEEEWIIRDFFGDRRGGVFVDVGASHYRDLSNTYYLEHQLGWSGIAVEPLHHFEADYKRYRPATRFRPFFVSDVSDEQVTMFTYDEKFTAASSDRKWVERFGNDPREVTASTITLDALLQREGVQVFDFLSMDIELAEPKALAGLDIERFKPALVCIEAHPEVRQQILDYFDRHGYRVLGKYLRADKQNLYFAPR